MRKPIVVLLFLSAAIPVTTNAQQTTALTEGVRVQVTPIRGNVVKGTLTSLSSDSLLVERGDKERSSVAMNIANVRAVQVSAGRNHLRGGILGGLIGLGTGAVAGALLGRLAWHEPSREEASGFLGCFLDCTPSFAMMAGAVGVGGLGLISGSILGSIRGTEKWTYVNPRQR